MNNSNLDVTESRLIYKDFIAGKIINAQDYIQGELQPSLKYRALVDNLDEYRELYSLIGFEIRAIGNNAFLVSRIERNEEFNEIAANIQVLLTVISRGLYSMGTSPSILADPVGGVSEKNINAIGDLEDEAKIIKACGLKLPLTRSVNGILVERGIVHKTRDDRYILSNAGKYFFDSMFTDGYEHEVDELKKV